MRRRRGKRRGRRRGRRRQAASTTVALTRMAGAWGGAI